MAAVNRMPKTIASAAPIPMPITVIAVTLLAVRSEAATACLASSLLKFTTLFKRSTRTICLSRVLDIAKSVIVSNSSAANLALSSNWSKSLKVSAVAGSVFA